MRMFTRGTQTNSDGSTAVTRDDGRRDATPATVPSERTWHRGPARAFATLVAVGVAGLLAWLTTNVNDGTTGGYWAVYGILAGAGLVMALSQLVGGWTKWGRPRLSSTVFLVAFVPTLIAVGWIMLFHQPHSTLFRGHVVNWSNDLGIAGFVDDMGGDLLTMLALGLGIVFGLSFDTAGPKRPTPPAVQQRTAPVKADADEPIARDREVVRS